MTANRTNNRAGFTLVEILIVVGIIGMLCAVAIPSFAKSRRDSRINRMINDLRIVYDAFNLYAMEHGNYPDTDNAGSSAAYGSSTPQPVADYLTGTKWSEPTVLGGRWLYIAYPRPPYNTYFLLVDAWNNLPGLPPPSQCPLAPADYWREIDRKLDDGNLSDGKFRLVGTQVQYSLNERDW